MQRFLHWREVLQLAPDVKTVNAVMHDYVRELSPLLDALPRPCRDALEGHFDVQAAAVSLLHEELRFKGSEELRVLLHEVAYTFASGAVRITLLHSKPVVAAE